MAVTTILMSLKNDYEGTMRKCELLCHILAVLAVGVMLALGCFKSMKYVERARAWQNDIVLPATHIQ